MNDIIHLLPDSVANQIAAGEVVQRPASIIKEMVENSIDAGATRVQVLVTDGGKTCVQIIDNGKGMSDTDARMAFERHATSKIREGADLFHLTTMGFRGEALASIAAVAQVELTTRRPDDELGTRIVLAGSHVESQEPEACPVGSNFVVKNLFYNVPARRKFLKSTQTELSNILTEFERIVLVYPHIEFDLYNNGVEVYRLRPGSPRARIVDVFGKRIDATLLPVDADTSIVKVSGYVAVPESARKKGSHQFFFVNGRFMRHPFFHSALKQAYANLVPAGEHVSYFIYFTIDPSEIDVNVHPAKTEIKFNNEQPIWQILLAAVKEALGKYVQVPTIDFDATDRPDIPAMGSVEAPAHMPTLSAGSFSPFGQVGQGARPRPLTDWQKLYASASPASAHAPSAPAPLPPAPAAPEADQMTMEPGPWQPSDSQSHVVDSRQSYTSAAPAASAPNLWAGTADERLATADELAHVGERPRFQWRDRFIVVSMPDSLLLVDQHRAHSRVLYEEYLQKIRHQERLSQGLLFPQLVQFSAVESATLDAIQPELEALGFELTSLGGGTYNVTGTPSALVHSDPAPLLHSLVYAAMEGNTQVRAEVARILAGAFSQSMAIGYGQSLTDAEMGDLLQRLFLLPDPAHTSEGKRIFGLVGTGQIEKLF